MSLSQIESTLKSLKDFFAVNGVFHIPSLQREFVWDAKKAERLFDDICEDSAYFKDEPHEDDSYLLGNIVLVQKEKIDDNDWTVYDVIDGQQRITVLSLLAKAIKVVATTRMNKASDSTEKEQWKFLLETIENSFTFWDKKHTISKFKITHDDTLRFGSCYAKIIKDSIPNKESDDIYTPVERNINDIYFTFEEKLSDFSDEQLKNFIVYYKDTIKLIQTITYDESKAFQLFEVLNDRGRSLDALDLIKNKFLSLLYGGEERSEGDLTIFNNAWSEMRNLVYSSQDSKAATRFLQKYLIGRRGIASSESEVYQKYKELVITDSDQKGAVLNYVEDMKKTAAMYTNLSAGNYDCFESDNNMYLLYQVLNLDVLYPALMPFYFEDDETKKSVLDHLVRLGLAAICSKTNMNTVSSALNSHIIEYYKKKDKDKDDAYKLFINYLDNDILEYATKAKSTLPSVPWGRQKKANNQIAKVLKCVEIYFNENLSPIQSPPNKLVVTVEHILSQELTLTPGKKWSDLGFTNEAEKKDYAHFLGNLTLLYSDKNSAGGKLPYKDKKAIYRDSCFRITKTMVEKLDTVVSDGMETKLFNKINKYEKQYKPDKGHWSKARIIKRGNDLSDLIYKILVKDV